MITVLHALPETFLLFTLGLVHMFAAILLDRARAQPATHQTLPLQSPGIEAAPG